MGRLLRFGPIGHGGLVVLVVFALSSCGTEQSGPTEEEASPPPREVTKEVTRTVTVAEAPPPAPRENADAPAPAPAPAPSQPPPPAASPPAVPAAPALPGQGSPEGVLALQYSRLNAGDYEGAYALFDEASKQAASADQYRAYFESLAPYSITDYSFPSVDVQGDTATVEAALTTSTAEGQESYQVTQELVREGEEWRPVMRDEQLASFAEAGQEVAQYEPESGSEPEPAPDSTSSGTIPGDGTFLVGEDIQPGTYQTDGGGEFGCYWARLADTSGEFEGIIANGNPQGPTTVTISASDAAFETNGCSDWTLR